MTMTPMMTAGDRAPDRPWLKNCANAEGISAMIPVKMISEMPFPIPLAVICSPSHIRNMVPPTSVTRHEIRKNQPGSSARPPDSRLMARP